MKTSLIKISIACAERLAKKIKAEIFNPRGLTLSLDTFLGKGEDVYLWDWEYGFTKIENPNSILGNAILTTIVDKPSDFRTEVSRFSHIYVHDKEMASLYVGRYNVMDVKSWKSNDEFELSQGDYENKNTFGQ